MIGSKVADSPGVGRDYPWLMPMLGKKAAPQPYATYRGMVTELKFFIPQNAICCSMSK
jgi:hypothetical protein